MGHNLGHVWGIIWGMSGHHLGHAWGIIWCMSGESSGACLGQYVNNGQQSLVLHASVKTFFCAICLELIAVGSFGPIAKFVSLVLFSVNLTHSGVLVVLVPVLVLSQRFQLGSD